MKSAAATLGVVLIVAVSACGGSDDSREGVEVRPGSVHAAADCLRDGGAKVTGKDQQLRYRFATVGAVGPDGSPIYLSTIRRRMMSALSKQARLEGPNDLIYENIDGNAIASVGADPTIEDWVLALTCLDRLPKKLRYGLDGKEINVSAARNDRYTAIFEQICGLSVGRASEQIMDVAAADGTVSAKELGRRADRLPKELAVAAGRHPGRTCSEFAETAKLFAN